MQAEGSENVTSVFFVTFCGRVFFFKLNMCIYNVYIYTDIYILGNGSMHIDFRSYLVVLWTFFPLIFFVGSGMVHHLRRWHKTSSCPLFLPILAAKSSRSGDWNWKGSRKKSLGFGWSRSWVPWVGFHRILKGGVVGDSPISSPNLS